MVERTVKVEFQTTAADYRRILFWYRRTRLLVGAILYLLVVIAIGWFLMFAGGGPSGRETSSTSTVFGLLLVLPVFLAASLFWQVWRQAKKVEKISEPGTATFSPSGLRFETASSTSESAWARYHRVYATTTDFILFPQDNIFYAIPKRFFRSQEDISIVNEILKEHLGERAKI
jgi:hypothetical protein